MRRSFTSIVSVWFIHSNPGAFTSESADLRRYSALLQRSANIFLVNWQINVINSYLNFSVRSSAWLEVNCWRSRFLCQCNCRTRIKTLRRHHNCWKRSSALIAFQIWRCLNRKSKPLAISNGPLAFVDISNSCLALTYSFFFGLLQGSLTFLVHQASLSCYCLRSQLD